MKLWQVLVCVGAITLAGCGGASVSNPSGSLGSIGSNPFGGREGPAEARSSRAAPDDDSVLVDRLESVVPEPALRGLILRATAVTPTQGWYGAELRPLAGGLPNAAGIVTYEFRAVAPEEALPQGPVRTRRLLAAAFIGDAELAGIRGFRVLGARNRVDLRR